MPLTNFPPFHKSRRLLLPVFFSVLVGCSEEIEVYRIPKEPVSMAEATDMAPLPLPEDAGLSWVAPSAWVSQPASGFRLASWIFKDATGLAADISVVKLSGDAGGRLANINRWRGQIGLPPIDEGDVAGVVRKIRSKAGDVEMVQFNNSAGNPPQGIMAGILSHGEATCFFKMMGAAAAVDKAESQFIEFLESLHE